MATVTQFPTAGAGTGWTSPGNITAEDSLTATKSLGATGGISGALIGSNFGFNALIPVGATITAIAASVKDRSSASGTIARGDGGGGYGVELLVGGVVKTADTGSPNLPTTLTWYLSSCSAWGGIARADLLDGTLTMQAQYINNDPSLARTVSVDAFQVAVTYTVPGGTFTVLALLGVG